MQLRKNIFRTPERTPDGAGVQKLYFCNIRSAKIVFLQLRKNIFRTPERTPDGAGVQKLYFCNIRSAKIVFLQLRKNIFRTPERTPDGAGVQKLYFCSCEKTFFALRKEHRTEPECKNYIFAVAKKHFSHSGKNTGRSRSAKIDFCNIRSAKIVFLQLRKNIFRTPERTPDGAGVQKLYFCSCEKTFFALRKEHRTEPECKNCIFAVAKKHFSHSGKNTGRSRSAKIVFLQLRKNIFRTPERTPDGAGVQKLYFCSCEKTFFALRKEHRTEPECKNCIFAISGVQKLYFCSCEKTFFALRREHRKICFLRFSHL
ncbi:Uncharacterized protein dnm_062270 [Desulfonema magnum]|uniref:Uncharacterized protein n=1 Tax=Desulfonema magnum TaxID=45655 RepID=A0A975BR52_9BACT|nr:Uncharacterized protein dnm_062270 [Desulfonema magnum]